jgi:hypothetical protein
MRTRALVVCALGLVLWGGLGCGNKAGEKATKADCEHIAEHVADLIVADAAANPDALYEAIKASPGDTRIPETVDKAGFATWLQSPEGKTWMLQRRGQTLSGTQQGVEPCVKRAAPKSWVTCMLAAKTKPEIEACDAKVGK